MSLLKNIIYAKKFLELIQAILHVLITSWVNAKEPVLVRKAKKYITVGFLLPLLNLDNLGNGLTKDQLISLKKTRKKISGKVTR